MTNRIYPPRVELWAGDPLEYRVGRERELASCVKTLQQRNQHVLLHGERGVGKSFLLKLIEGALRDPDSDVFPCYLSLSEIDLYTTAQRDVSRYVLLKTCAAIWTRVFERSYLELRESLGRAGTEITLKSPEERALLRIYSHLMPVNRSHSILASSSVGFSAGATGEKKEQATQNLAQPDLMPFELAEICAELCQNVLAKRDKRTVAVLCDEANIVQDWSAAEMHRLQSELLGPQGMNFVHTIATGLFNPTAKLPIGFELEIQLGGLAPEQQVRTLLEGILKYERTEHLKFEDSAVAAIFSCLGGSPRNSIEACQYSKERAHQLGASVVTEAMALWACRNVEERSREAIAHMPRP